jgi:vancomycin resistance protein YoaR
MGTKRWILPTILAPVVLVVVVVIAWAVDTSSAGVARNVHLEGEDISRLSHTELASRVATLADRFGDVPVEIVAQPGRTGGPSRTYRTTAAELGLLVDQDRTVEAALEVGDDALFLLRPFSWVRSFVAERDAPLELQVSGDQVATTVRSLEGKDEVAPVEPQVIDADGRFSIRPGTPGTGLDPAKVAAALPAAVRARVGDGPVRVVLRRGTVPPRISDEAARAALSEAPALTGEPVQVQTSAGQRTVPVAALRSWLVVTKEGDGTAALGFDPAKVEATLRSLFSDIPGAPVDAHFTVTDGTPVVVPDLIGKVCCGEGATAALLTARRAGDDTVHLELVDAAPRFTAAAARRLGIVEEVGQPTLFGPTTMHKCCESRVQNIHRIADLVRGHVILPGQTFSINDFIGPRTRAKGFTDGGAILDGELGTSVGGGISQFATTFFNASLYAGLDFSEYQSHSLYISRYPKGHDATLSYPHPDLKVRNTTPYGILIWPTYTGTSITVHLYSTHHVDVQLGEPTASASGRCTRWTTPRTRTYLDGHVTRDSVSARYRPAEGVDC